MDKKDEIKVTETEDDVVNADVQTKKLVDIESQTMQSAKVVKKPLTPYQKYKQSKNQNGKKYFEFYDDIKVYTHNVYDW